MYEMLAPVDRLVARSRQLSELQAALLADLVAVADSVPVAEFAPFEISAALTWTRQAAHAQLDLAQSVVRRLPTVHKALALGEIDIAKARVIVDGVSSLDLPAARQVAVRVLSSAPGLTTGQLRAQLAKLVIEVSPDAAEIRHRQRVRERRVVLQPTGDGCASIFGIDLPAADALAATNRLRAIARSLRQAGDSRGIDQLMADALLDLLLGKPSHTSAAGGGVELVGSLETLTRLASHPAQLAGYGPVIADIARQVAEQQRQTPWIFSIHDPATGQVFTGTTRRRPSAAVARDVVARDRTCRAPGCRVPASRADLDHTVAWELGGPTAPGNLGVLCRHHHRAKHDGGWILRQVKPGHFVWRSPLGKSYVVAPEPP